MTVQIIEKDGRPEWAVVPYETYEQLVQDAEMLQDVCDYDEARKAVAEGEELVPADVVYAILDGQNPVRVWREHRGLSQQKAAARGSRVAAASCPAHEDPGSDGRGRRGCPRSRKLPEP